MGRCDERLLEAADQSTRWLDFDGRTTRNGALLSSGSGSFSVSVPYLIPGHAVHLAQHVLESRPRGFQKCRHVRLAVQPMTPCRMWPNTKPVKRRAVGGKGKSTVWEARRTATAARLETNTRGAIPDEKKKPNVNLYVARPNAGWLVLPSRPAQRMRLLRQERQAKMTTKPHRSDTRAPRDSCPSAFPQMRAVGGTHRARHERNAMRVTE